MKKFIILLSLMILTMQLTGAEETQIRDMIRDIQQSDESVRYQKMNEFKIMLRTMNAENRKAAISQLQQGIEKESKNREQQPEIQHGTAPDTKNSQIGVMQRGAQQNLRMLQNQQNNRQTGQIQSKKPDRNPQTGTPDKPKHGK